MGSIATEGRLVREVRSTYPSWRALMEEAERRGEVYKGVGYVEYRLRRGSREYRLVVAGDGTPRAVVVITSTGRRYSFPARRVWRL